MKKWYTPYIAPVAFLVSILTLVILWEDVGLPRPALSSEMEEVMAKIQMAGAYQKDTREMLLRDRLWEKRYQLDRTTDSQRRLELKRDIELILRQLKNLRSK